MSEETGAIRHPRETSALFGHAEAEQALLSAYKSGRIPHAWLIGGEPGIGKATLAFRFARFVLAHPEPRSAEVQRATSLSIEADPASRRKAAQAQSNFRVLERVINEDSGKLYTTIRVDDTRRIVRFLSSTAGEGDWRIVVVDTVDDMNAESANAVLKILEEPPERALLLLISNSPGRELPTIRSRCRRLLLRPLDEHNVAMALATAMDRSPDDNEIREAAAASAGSVGRAAALLEGEALVLRGRVLELVRQLPSPDARSLHALGDALGGTDPQTLAVFVDLVNEWLSKQLSAASLPQQARIAEVWERVNSSARDVDDYNLERKPFVFSTFAALSQLAAR